MHANRNKHSYKYRSTAPCLVEALYWTALYFQEIQTPPAKQQIAPEYQPGVVEKENWLTRGFKQIRNQPRKPEIKPEPLSPSMKPILKNKTADQNEEILLPSDEKDLDVVTDVYKKLNGLTKYSRQSYIPVEDDFQKTEYPRLRDQRHAK